MHVIKDEIPLKRILIIDFDPIGSSLFSIIIINSHLLFSLKNKLIAFIKFMDL